VPVDNYERRFIPARTVDGDTLKTDRVDLGFHQSATDDIQFRLYGINCPESNKRATAAAGKAATRFTAQWVSEHLHGGTYLVCKTLPVPGVQLQDSFGRYIALIFCMSSEHPQSLNAALVESGNAVPFMLL
jgi:endonuclease YncB( thermonuclease family)